MINKTKKCPACFGAGKITTETGEAGQYRFTSTCDRCGGSGNVRAGVTRIPRTEEEKSFSQKFVADVGEDWDE